LLKKRYSINLKSPIHLFGWGFFGSNVSANLDTKNDVGPAIKYIKKFLAETLPLLLL